MKNKKILFSLITAFSLVGVSNAQSFLAGQDFNTSSFGTATPVVTTNFTVGGSSSLFTLHTNTAGLSSDGDPYSGLGVTSTGWLNTSEANSLAGSGTFATAQYRTEAAAAPSGFGATNGFESGASNIGLSFETFDSGYFSIEVNSAINDFNFEFDVIGGADYAGNVSYYYINDANAGDISVSIPESALTSGTFSVGESSSKESLNIGNIDEGFLVFSLVGNDASTGTGNAGNVALGIGFDNFAVSGTVVPEPSTYALIAGALALGFVAYRRRK